MIELITEETIRKTSHNTSNQVVVLALPIILSSSSNSHFVRDNNITSDNHVTVHDKSFKKQ